MSAGPRSSRLGMRISITARRKNRSARKRPCRTASRRSLLVAATRRKSSLTASVEPSRVITFSSSTRSSLACWNSGRSPPITAMHGFRRGSAGKASSAPARITSTRSGALAAGSAVGQAVARPLFTCIVARRSAGLTAQPGEIRRGAGDVQQRVAAAPQPVVGGRGRALLVEFRGWCRYARIDAVDFVDAPPSPPPLSRSKRERGANKREGKVHGIAGTNACERSDALRARAVDLR
ncbi:hypothetical protein CBM2618_B40026 [Cupriavidus taiwanensis]|nr:hypothetical protein CBM2591_B20026 [Cupriavidus taiwanensis]SOZ88062.1 hypothetical protein CBM2618_B40026 [Cupriavidus taiwanensis]SPD56086.1 protein of unknown function [Cupriavidus taiwanensis]